MVGGCGVVWCVGVSEYVFESVVCGCVWVGVVSVCVVFESTCVW